MSYLRINYTIKPGTSKTTYLINPKGFGIKNDFAKKMLIGVFNNSSEKSKLISEYQRLNPSFPMSSWYVSDSKGNKISTVQPTTQTAVTQIPSTQVQVVPPKIIQDTTPQSVVINIPTENDKENILDSPLLKVGILLGLGYFIFFND